jgi:hypothetical protein
VEKILPELYNRGYRIDKLVLDPPRKGCDESILKLIAQMRVKRLVYISCNPATLARDLSYLKDQGYKIDVVTPLDMFPQTYHIECIAKLTHQPTTFLRSVMRRVPSSKIVDPYTTNILEEESASDEAQKNPVRVAGVLKKTISKKNIDSTPDEKDVKSKGDSTSKLSLKTNKLKEISPLKPKKESQKEQKSKVKDKAKPKKKSKKKKR